MNDSNAKPRLPLTLVAVFLILSGTFIIIGSKYSANIKKQITDSQTGTIQSIAELKAQDLSNWRNERLGDILSLAQSPIFLATVKEWLDNGAKEDAFQKSIRVRLEIAKKYYRYHRLYITDNANNVLLDTHQPKEDIDAESKNINDLAVKSKQTIFGDFCRTADGKEIILPMVSPLILEDHLMGSIGFEIDANTYLYPMIQSWPEPSRTAETLLVEPKDGNVLFLNELRHITNTALSLKIPLSQAHLPAAMAAIGKEGIVQGVDYRDKEVLAYLKRIPDTPWSLVAKIDMEEILAVNKTQERNIIIIIIVLIGLTGAVVLLISNIQRRRSYQNLYLAQKKQTEAEQALLRERQTTEQYINIMGGILVVLDKNGTITLINPKGAEALGYKPDDLPGKNWFDTCLPVKLQEESKKEFMQAISGNADLPRHFGNPVLTRSGEERIIVWYNSFLRDENGGITALLSSGIDITERKKAEEELNKYHNFLEEEVKKKSRDLLEAQKRLSEAEKLAMLGQLSAGLVHEINNPLYGISNTLEILNSESLNDEQKEYLGMIHQGVDIIQSVTGSLLDLSQVDRLELSPTDIGKLINEILLFLKPKLDAEQIEVLTTFQENIPPIRLDKNKMKQVLLNLFKNSVESFADNGKIEITAKTDGNNLTLTVKDNGCGIPANKLPEIFKPFVSSKRPKRPKGTGLGLFMASHIIAAHKGKIEVFSPPGQGTTFTITLPLS